MLLSNTTFVILCLRHASPFVLTPLRPLPNLWYFENEWTDFDAHRHKWSHRERTWNDQLLCFRRSRVI